MNDNLASLAQSPLVRSLPVRSSATLPHPRQLGSVNWLGLRTLASKEIGRFIKVYAQTIAAPVITTLLFYIVFSMALGGAGRMVGDVPYMQFLAPGLVMMSMAQNAFANTSSSMVIAKIQGNIVDVLMPPLSPMELTVGYVLGGVARGALVGVFSIVVLALLTSLPVTSLGFILFFGLTGAMMLALLGLIGGIWSEKFDHLAAVQNFIIMPATFLSGTFFAVGQLPPVWQSLCRLDPFFYMIDGFRYGFTGLSDGTLGTGIVVMLGANMLLFAVAYAMIARGYKLKS